MNNRIRQARETVEIAGRVDKRSSQLRGIEAMYGSQPITRRKQSSKSQRLG